MQGATDPCRVQGSALALTFLPALAGAGPVAAILLLAGVALVPPLCALFFPDQREELNPALWALAASDSARPASPAPAEWAACAREL